MIEILKLVEYFTCDANHNIVYNISHRAGDPVLDSSGAIVYKYRKGDAVLDINIPI